MKKVKKSYKTFYLTADTHRRLKELCENSGTWNMSVFVDVAIQEKLKKDKKSENKC